jgi:hypothetical protein
MRCFLNVPLFFVLVICNLLNAQDFRRWEPVDGVPVRQGGHLEWSRSGAYQTAGEFTGEAAVVWSDSRNGDWGVFMQAFDSEGEPKFPENGLQVVDCYNRQVEPVVAACSDGGWFVAWKDFDPDFLGNIYCAKVTAEGEVVWGEENRGLTVCTAPGVQENPVIIEDDNGGCIIAWLDQRGNDRGNIFAMHVLTDGRIDPNWTENGVVIVRARDRQVNHDAITDGNGGMIIVWRDFRRDGDTDVWAKRINPEGELLWGEGAHVCDHEASQGPPKLSPDGEGGAFIVWADARNCDENDWDIFMQRINSDGEPHWGEPGDGVPLCTVEEEQRNPKIITSEPGSAIVVWEDRRVNPNFDLYAMRVSGEDEITFEWDAEGGVPVVTDDRNQTEDYICQDGNGGAYIVWAGEDRPGFPDLNIYAQLLNIDGEVLWEENGIPVTNWSGLLFAPIVLPNLDEHILVCWGDSITSSNQIIGQRLNLNGERLWGEGVEVFTGISGNALNKQILSRGNGDLAIVWLDTRFGASGNFPFLQICRNVENGPEFLLERQGIPLLPPEVTRGGGRVQAVISSDDAIIVAWEDRRRDQPRSIYAQKINWEGELLWAEGGVRCADMDYRQGRPQLCSDGNGGAIIAYRYRNEDDYYNIHMQRIDWHGTRLWGEEGFQLTRNPFDEDLESISSDGEGGAVLVWEVQDLETKDLWVQRVNENHELLWGENRPLCDEIGSQYNPVIAQHEEGYIVVWQDERIENAGYIFGQFINNDGSFRWYRWQNGYLISGWENNAFHPAVTIGEDGSIWIAWEDYRLGREADLYLQKLSAQINNMGDPVILFREDNHPIYDGIPVCSADGEQQYTEIISDGNNGIWLVWMDSRLYIGSDIYATHLTSNGIPFDDWSENGRVVCQATHEQITPKVVLIDPSGSEGVAVAWTDKRSTHNDELYNIYLQRLDDEMVSVPELTNTLPSEFYLHEPYPNPFNSTSMIHYQLPLRGLTSLSIYDLQGREVMSLFNEMRDRGSYTVPISADQLPAGLYIVRLNSQGFTSSRKIAVVK